MASLLSVSGVVAQSATAVASLPAVTDNVNSVVAADSVEIANINTSSLTDSINISQVASDREVWSLHRSAMQPLDLEVGSTLAQSTDAIEPYTLPKSVMDKSYRKNGGPISIYSLPYSMTGSSHDWRRLWINTGVLTGAFVGTLLVLECLPEDATTWNRAALQQIPLFKRWHDHVLVDGPEWDHDKFIFNYVLHPYAGAVYFMSARSVGFNFWQSLLYSTIISDVGWEFGIEAFMERPSYQDLFITPLVGSAIGEGFYKLKRHIVDNDYRLFGSPVIGNVVAFLIDPVNEVVGLFDHNPARREARARRQSRGEGISFVPMVAPGYGGFSMVATF